MFQVDDIDFDEDFGSDFNVSEPPQKTSFNSPPTPTPTRPKCPNFDVLTRSVGRTVRDRRFPGPAGLLPERNGNSSLIATEDFLNELESESNDTSNPQEVMSQTSNTIFVEGPWAAMLADLGPKAKDVIAEINLGSIQGIGKSLKGSKVPLLAILIQSLDSSLPDPALTLKDATAEMSGVLHRDVWEEFKPDIMAGSVVVLSNVGVINTGSSSRKLVINITMTNLAAIYTQKKDGTQVKRIKPLNLQGNTHTQLVSSWKSIVEALETRPAKTSLTSSTPLKRPRLDPPPKPFTTDTNEWDVESLLEGIDTDSLLGEF